MVSIRDGLAREVALGGHAGIVAEGLVCVYRPRGRPPVTALDGVSFEVRPGEIVGLLGPNGAGKTTCVRVLSTLLLPTSGRASVGGSDVLVAPKRVRARCGVLFGGDLGLYTRLSARDNLRYFATMYRLDGATARRRIGELLQQVGLAARARDKVEGFSRGMRQRLHLARVLLHDPPVLLLDEPSAGLDPQAARDLRGLVRGLAGQGRAILLTTHDLAEAEALCPRIVLLAGGRIMRQATTGELRNEASAKLGSVVEVDGGPPLGDEVLQGVPGLVRWAREGSAVRVQTREPAAAAGFLLDRVGEGGGTVHVARPTLEDAYLELVAEPPVEADPPGR